MTTYLIIAALFAFIIVIYFVIDIARSYKKRVVKSQEIQSNKFYTSQNYDVLYEDSPDGGGALSMWLSEDVMLYGRPDLVIKDRTTGEVRVIDYKSGVRKSSGVMPLRFKVQLAAYFILVEHEFGIRPTKGIIKYLEDESEDEMPNDPVFLEKVKKEAMELAVLKRDIERASRTSDIGGESGKELVAKRSHHDPVVCQVCEYKNICPEKL